MLKLLLSCIALLLFSPPGLKEAGVIPSGNFMEYSIQLKTRFIGTLDTTSEFITMTIGEVRRGDSAVEVFKITRDSVSYYYDGNGFTISDHRKQTAITYRVDPTFYIKAYELEQFLDPLRVKKRLNKQKDSLGYSDYKRTETVFNGDSFTVINASKNDSMVFASAYFSDYRLVYPKKDPFRFKLEEWYHVPGAEQMNAYMAYLVFEAAPAFADLDVQQDIPPAYKKRVSYGTTDLYHAPLDSGTFIPDIRFLLASGDSASLSSYAGDIILLDFWFVECLPCAESAKFFNRLSEEMKGQKLTILGLNPINAPIHIQKHASEKSTAYATASFDRGLAKRLFHVYSFPSFILLNKNRQVVWSQEGYSPATEAKIRKRIADLLGGE